MANSSSRFLHPVRALAHGFHHRRFQAGDIGFDAFIWRGATDGPVLLLNGATHGDEYEGPTLLRDRVARWRPKELRGTVVMVPVLNEAAFFAAQRCHPGDGGNLARSFPGAARGSASARLAHLFDTQLLAQCTHYVDLHSAGAAYELVPWCGYMTRADSLERAQRQMAACFGSYFWCWAAPYLPGRTLSAAHGRGVAAIYVECRGAGGIDARDLRALDHGVTRLLRQIGCLPGRVATRAQNFRETTDAEEAHLQVHHPAPHDGLFVPSVALGTAVRRGELCGTVRALDAQRETAVRAEAAGRIVMLRRQRSVRRGDALCVLAPG